jgi:hypothetical protein
VCVCVLLHCIAASFLLCSLQMATEATSSANLSLTAGSLSNLSVSDSVSPLQCSPSMSGALLPQQQPPPGAFPPGVRSPGTYPSGAMRPPPRAGPPSGARPPAQAFPPPGISSGAGRVSPAAFRAHAAAQAQASTTNVSDLWSSLVARRSAESRADSVDRSREPRVLFLGPRGAGKSSLHMAYMFKERDLSLASEAPKLTTALDYKYARLQPKQDSSSLAGAAAITAGGTSASASLEEQKTVTHFWELGGGRALASQLLPIPLSAAALPHALLVLVLDLSAPHRAAADAAHFLALIKASTTQAQEALAKDTSGTANGAAVVRQLHVNARRRFGESHADLNRVELLPVPVLIVGHKLDLIQSTLEPESLRILSRTLRALAHVHGASLLYTSTARQHKDNLLKAFRAKLTQHVLSGGSGKAAPPPSLDHTTSLIQVAAGQDSFFSIGEAPGVGGAGLGGKPAQAWLAACTKHFAEAAQGRAAREADLHNEEAAAAGAECSSNAVSAPPQLDGEKVVDAALKLRQEDLTNLQRELALRRKLNVKEAHREQQGIAASAGRLR